jgi:sulfopropanediol 3-dehydrogenase
MTTIVKAAEPGATTAAAQEAVRETVTGVIGAIRARGDDAVREYSQKFDNWSPESFRLSAAQVGQIVSGVPAQVIDDIQFVQEQVRTFARAQLDSMREFEIETLPGVKLGQKHNPVAAAGAYVPGGRYPLVASAHMTIVTAKVDLLAGPGNAYVAEAKRQLFGEVGIDLFAGPTEILIVADPVTVAVDLLSQAEHGPDPSLARPRPDHRHRDPGRRVRARG